MDLDFQRAIEVLRKIDALNKAKLDAARRLNDEVNNVARISAEIGQLQTELKEMKPCHN